VYAIPVAPERKLQRTFHASSEGAEGTFMVGHDSEFVEGNGIMEKKSKIKLG